MEFLACTSAMQNKHGLAFWGGALTQLQTDAQQPKHRKMGQNMKFVCCCTFKNKYKYENRCLFFKLQFKY